MLHRLSQQKSCQLKTKDIFFPEPQGPHGVTTVANTFDISTSVIKVCKGWRELLTFMVIKKKKKRWAMHCMCLTSSREGSWLCIAFWSGQVNERQLVKNNKAERCWQTGTRCVWGWRRGTKEWHSTSRKQKKKKRTFVIPAITNRMKKYIMEHAWPASQGRGHTACPSRLQGTTRQRAPLLQYTLTLWHFWCPTTDIHSHPRGNWSFHCQII